jgi:thymidylate synthase (FAD)
VTEVRLQSHSDVELVEYMGSDEGVVRRARVSVRGGNDDADLVGNGAVAGMIRHMLKNQHMSVFEGAQFTFRVHTPIFVAREFMRHRTVSFNEESARYRQLEPLFWVPDQNRKLRQVGKASSYTLVDGEPEDFPHATESLEYAYGVAYGEYEAMLRMGIAREVARAVLPVGIFTSFYATMNARNLMHFLTLRVDDERNEIPTHPQAEIQEVAAKMEHLFAEVMPETHAAFVANGRRV